MPVSVAGAAAPRLRGFLRDRHPGDVLRLATGTVVLLLTAQNVEAGEVGGLETNVFRVINEFPLPDFLWPALWLVMQLGNLGAVPATALAAALTRRWRLALDFLTAGGAIYLVAMLVKATVDRGRPQALLDGVTIIGDPAGGLGYVSGHSAVAVALATVAAPYLTRRWRRVAWLLATLVCLSRVYVGAHLPWDVVGGAALGWMAGAIAHLVLGAPEGHPTPEWVRRALSQWGWSPTEVEAIGRPTRRSASFRVRDAGRGDVFVKVVSRERRDDDFIYRAWRLIGDHRVLHAPDYGSPLRQVEHEALMAYIARTHGVRVPDVIGARSFGNGAAVLVQEWVEGRPLEELGPEPITENLVHGLSEQLDRLRSGLIEHGELNGHNVMADRTGRVWITNFAEARQVGDAEAVDREASQLLGSLSATALAGDGRVAAGVRDADREANDGGR